jgi:hypothetical protein
MFLLPAEESMARWLWTLKFGLAASMLVPVSVMAEMELVLVEENVRLIIPEAGIRSIEVETWTAKTIPNLKTFSVAICLTRYHKNRVCDVSRRFVGRPLELRMGCELLATPVIREPLCNNSCFLLSAETLEDAHRQAAKLRAASRISCRPTS